MINSIWQEDNEYYRLKPLTDAMVKEAEDQLNVKLPDSYINILKEQNGGYINYDSFPCSTPTSWADDHVNVDHIFGIGKENSILDSEYLIKEWDLPSNIVLISGSGHSWIALDYRETEENPPVIFIDVDDEKVIELAANFDLFLDGLMIWEGEA